MLDWCLCQICHPLEIIIIIIIIIIRSMSQSEDGSQDIDQQSFYGWMFVNIIIPGDIFLTFRTCCGVTKRKWHCFTAIQDQRFVENMRRRGIYNHT